MTDRRPMKPGERSAAYIRSTGHLPPHWTAEQCERWHVKVTARREVAVWGLGPDDRARGRRWLTAYGLE